MEFSSTNYSGQPNGDLPHFVKGDYKDKEIQSALKSLELQIKMRLDGLLAGNNQSVLPGIGSELGEHRLYEIGDDVRKIDWNASARTTQTHIRQTIADRDITMWIVVDLSASLDFGTVLCTKRQLMVAGIAAMLNIGSRGANKIGAVISDGSNLDILHPRSNNLFFRQILTKVATTIPKPSSSKADLNHALESVRYFAKSRSLVVVGSDFLGPLDWELSYKKLGSRNQMMAVEVLDPRDIYMPAVGEISLQDPETGTVRQIMLNKKTSQMYTHAAFEHREHVHKILRGCRTTVLELNTEREWKADLARFAQLNRKYLKVG